jgi:hypothetical protein
MQSIFSPYLFKLLNVNRRDAENAKKNDFPFAVERTAKGNRSAPLKAGR